MSLDKIIGTLHVAWTIFISIYGFIVSKKWGYDFYYIGYTLLLVISWLLCKDECFITYVYKKILDPTYTMGKDPNRMADSENIFGKDLSKYVMNTLLIITVCSLYIVSSRNNFAPHYLWILFILCYYIYLLILRKFYAPRFYETYLKKHNPAFRILFFGITGLYLWFLIIGGKNAYLG
jgi:hypothetical protein